MSRKNRERRERKHEHVNGWIVELATPMGYPAGRFWFNTKFKLRHPPKNAARMMHHTNMGGPLHVASSRPATQERR